MKKLFMLFFITAIMAQSTHENSLPLGSMLMEYKLGSVLGAGRVACANASAIMGLQCAL